jgi:hypothetical protein
MAMNAGKTRNKPGTDFRGETPFVPWCGGERGVESLGLLAWQGLALHVGIGREGAATSSRSFPGM